MKRILLSLALCGVLAAQQPVSLMPQSGMPSYAAAKTGLAVAASATDIAVLSGNASNTVVVQRVVVTCNQTTAGTIDVQLLIRTAADTVGTSTTITGYPLDQNNAAATSSVLAYTANPTVNDATTRIIGTAKLECAASTTAAPNDIYIWTPAQGQTVVLRGTAQQLAVNLNGQSVTGSSFDISIQWGEKVGL